MKPIAVGGIAQDMVDDFPFSDENSGNMIHGRAPFEMFNSAVDVRRSGWRKYYQAGTPIDFINGQCSHYVFSCANFLQFGNFTDRKRAAYSSLQKSLEPVEVPLVIFGLGAQAPASGEISPDGIPPEAVEFMKFLGEKCEVISVRGEFTARVFRELAGVENTLVTGCPSFFQRPDAFAELKEYLKGPREGVLFYNATHLRSKEERVLMQRAILEHQYWLEVHSAEIHRFHVDAMTDPELAEPPLPLHYMLAGTAPDVRRDELVAYFAHRYRIFRDTRPWYQFNKEYVRLSYGTRFHGNMAALLAGRPGLWLTHDSRTAELTRTLHLPALTVSDAASMTTEEIENSVDFDPMFEALPKLFETFNEYLATYGLPQRKLSL
ncbi:polysaccharide pyruvyl transferase family protein [Brachybacterium sp. AOP42-C2-15]|uniref:polysaccharide pyruvyl transferase family protein n=1 Tax=Brachybacterium sp. AOP42-C2-15 TaxID=3457670 RepID=UPI00403404E4